MREGGVDLPLPGAGCLATARFPLSSGAGQDVGRRAHHRRGVVDGGTVAIRRRPPRSLSASWAEGGCGPACAWASPTARVASRSPAGIMFTPVASQLSTSRSPPSAAGLWTVPVAVGKASMSAAARTQPSISCRVPILCPVVRSRPSAAARREPEAASWTTARCNDSVGKVARWPSRSTSGAGRSARTASGRHKAVRPLGGRRSASPTRGGSVSSPACPGSRPSGWPSAWRTRRRSS